MPLAVSPTPLAQAASPCHLDGWMAPSPIAFGASTPSYSPCRAVSSASMGGEYFLTARPNMPSVEVTRSGHPTAIVEWAACASAAAVSASVDDVLEYWMTYAHPQETALFKQPCDLYCNISGLPLYPDREMQAPVGVYLPCDVRLSLPPSPSYGGESGSNGTLTCRSFLEGEKTIAGHGGTYEPARLLLNTYFQCLLPTASYNWTLHSSLLRFPSEGWMDQTGSLVGVPNMTCMGFASLLTWTMSCRRFTAFFETLISWGRG